MPKPLAHHPRFHGSEGLRTACARLRRNDEIDPVQVRADAQTLMREMEACFHWLEGLARRERLERESAYPSVVFIPDLSAEDLAKVVAAASSGHALGRWPR